MLNSASSQLKRKFVPAGYIAHLISYHGLFDKAHTTLFAKCTSKMKTVTASHDLGLAK
jgi:hypothetical protein